MRSRLEDPFRASSDPVFDADERLVMRYAIAMTREVRVSPALFAEVRGRFSTSEIVELTATIATYNLVARVLVALEVDPEP